MDRWAVRDWLLGPAAFGAVVRGGAGVAVGWVGWHIDPAGPVGLSMRAAVGVVAAVLAARPAVYFGRPVGAAVLAWARSRRVTTAYPCPECGYDIRMTPHRCPECGTELAWGFRRSAGVARRRRRV